MAKSHYSPWETCARGHDIKGPNAFIYDAGNRRQCRFCVLENNAGKKNGRPATKARGVIT